MCYMPQPGSSGVQPGKKKKSLFKRRNVRARLCARERRSARDSERPACLRASAPRVQECTFLFARVQKSEHLAGNASAREGWKKKKEKVIRPESLNPPGGRQWAVKSAPDVKRARVRRRAHAHAPTPTHIKTQYTDKQTRGCQTSSFPG